MARKLGRKVKNRKMMLRNMVTSVIIYEKIITTEAKAKETKGLVDKVINLAKKNTLSARRNLLGFLTHKNATKKLFEVLTDRYQDRNSGYTRTYKLTPRLGDSASRMMIQLIPAETKIKEKKDIKNDKKEKTDKINKKDN